MNDPSRSAALRQLGLLLAIVVPTALLLFLYSADFFDSYEGSAVAHRPVFNSDGEGDKVRRYLLLRPGGAVEDVVLPTAAMDRYDLPLSLAGVPPLEMPANAPTLRKELFSFTVSIAGTPWSTMRAADLILPVLMVIFAVFARNVLTTGSAFNLVPTGPSALPGIRQEQAGVVQQPRRQRPGKSPPPGRSSRKGKRSKRPR